MWLNIIHATMKPFCHTLITNIMEQTSATNQTKPDQKSNDNHESANRKSKKIMVVLNFTTLTNKKREEKQNISISHNSHPSKHSHAQLSEKFQPRRCLPAHEDQSKARSRVRPEVSGVSAQRFQECQSRRHALHHTWSPSCRLATGDAKQNEWKRKEDEGLKWIAFVWTNQLSGDVAIEESAENRACDWSNNRNTNCETVMKISQQIKQSLSDHIEMDETWA